VVGVTSQLRSKSPKKANEKRTLVILGSLFRANGHESCVLVNTLPTSIFHRDNWDFEGQAPYMNADQARVLFRLSAQALPSTDVKRRIEYLRRYKGDPWARTTAELGEGLLRVVVRVDEEPPRFDDGVYSKPQSTC
jgi:hypothetical protein